MTLSNKEKPISQAPTTHDQLEGLRREVSSPQNDYEKITKQIQQIEKAEQQDNVEQLDNDTLNDNVHVAPDAKAKVKRTIDQVNTKVENTKFDVLMKGLASWVENIDDSKFFGLAGLFKILMKFLIPNKYLSESENNNESEGDESGVESGRRKIVAGYVLGIKFLLSVSKEDAQESYSILMSEKIKNKSYNELEISSLQVNNKDGIGKKYGFEGEDEAVYQTLLLLKNKESYLNLFFEKQKIDWKNLSLEEVFLYMYNYNKILSSFSSISFDEFITGKFNMFDLFEDENTEGNMYSLLESRKSNENSKLYGVSDTFLIAVYGNNTGEVDPELMNGYEGADREFINDFIRFGNELPGFISSYMFLGKEDRKQEFSDYFANYEFTQKDILQFYILTDGNLDYNSFNDLELGLLYFKVFQILESGTLRGETYIYTIVQGIMGNSSELLDKVPESFRVTILDYIKHTGVELLDTIEGFIGDLWGSLTSEQKIALSVAGIGVLAIAVLLVKTGAVAIIQVTGILLGTGITVFSIYKLYDFLTDIDNNEIKDILNKYDIDSKEKFEQVFTDSLV